MIHTSTNKVCCFGELLLRFALPNQWLSKEKLPYYVGGAELNVATALANWGATTSYITSLPDNYLGKEIAQYIDKTGISIQDILYAGKRVGIYYLPEGNDVKSQGVIYDREHSSFSMIQPGTINWDAVFEDCNWFHFSAIIPALNSNLALVCKEAVEAADAKGLTISVDLNYRNKLWQYGVKPLSIMPELVKYCNVIMGNMWSAESLLGVRSPIHSSDGLSEVALSEAAVKSMRSLKESFPKASAIAYTHRLPEKYWGVLHYDQKDFISNLHNVKDAVGQVGSGDCFMAGLIFGFYQAHEPQQTLEFATAAAFNKLFIPSDCTTSTVHDINKTLAAHEN